MAKYLSWILLSCALLVVAHGHAHVHKSEPENNSVIATLPKNITLEFNEQVQVTALTLQKGDAPAQELGPLPTTAAKQVAVAMPPVATGNYIIKWRAVSGDSHIMSGKILFKVVAKE